MITSIHAFRTMLSSVAALNSLCALLTHPSHPQTVATTDLFTVSVVLPVPERRTVGITCHVFSSDWLLSLSNAFGISPGLFIAQ